MYQKIKNLKLQHKLIFMVSVSLLLSLLCLILFNNQVFKAISHEQVHDITLPRTLQSIRNDIEKNLAAPIAHTKAMGENTFLKNWWGQGEDNAQLNLISEYLQKLKSTQGLSAVAVVSKSTQNYYTEKGLLKQLGAGDDWFQRFLNSNQQYELNIGANDQTKVPTLFVNYRVESNGQVLGVVSVGQELDRLSDMVTQYRLGETGGVYLVDGEGKIKVHENPDFSDRRTLHELLGVTNVDSLLQGGESMSVMDFERAGESYLAASLLLPSLNWFLIAEVSYEELFAGINSALLKMAVVGLVILILSVAVASIVSKTITKPITNVSNALVEISQGGGDLTQRLAVDRFDEIGFLAQGFNSFVEQLQNLIRNVTQTGEQVERLVTGVSDQVHQTANQALEQQTMTEHVATAIHQMGATVQEIATNATETSKASESAKDESEEGHRVTQFSVEQINALSNAMQEASHHVEALASEVTEISSVLDVIIGISEQTNLLALNAAIEAARAGEQGRGFAVVADEVRTLAQKTQESTEEIRRTINNLESGARNAVLSMESGTKITKDCVDSVNDAGSRLTNITNMIQTVNDMTYQIAAATEEQTTVTDSISENVERIATITQITSEAAKMSESQCAEAKRLSSTLMEKMRVFKV